MPSYFVASIEAAVGLIELVTHYTHRHRTEALYHILRLYIFINSAYVQNTENHKLNGYLPPKRNTHTKYNIVDYRFGRYSVSR